MIAAALLALAPLTCGAVPRPGVATLGPDGVWRGSAVDACRRAAARLGRPVAPFHAYRTLAALREARRDDIAFLSEPERQAIGAAATVPAVARSVQLLVAPRPALSAGRPTLCFIIGSAAEDALARWLTQTGRAAILLGFQEPDEMADGLASGTCAAAAIDAADRAPADATIETLATLPLDAVTGGRYAAAIAAALHD